MSKTDLEESAKEMDIYIAEPKAGDSRLPRIKENLGVPDLRKREKNEIAKFIELGFEPDEAKRLAKENIFRMKKLEEEQIEQ